MQNPNHLTGVFFGLVIAFLVPGMIGLYAASFYVPVIRDWFMVAATTEAASVGGFLLVILGSSGMGVFISGVRWSIFDSWRKMPSLDTKKRSEHQTELVYQNFVLHFYNFYQFYSNTAVALVLLYVAWIGSVFMAAESSMNMTRLVATTALLGLSSLSLVASALNSRKRYDQEREHLLGLLSKTNQETA